MDRQTAGPAFADVAKETVWPFGPLGPEVVVGWRVVAHQAMDDARRGDFVGDVGRAVDWKRFTVGHGGGRTLGAFSPAVWFSPEAISLLDGSEWPRLRLVQ